MTLAEKIEGAFQKRRLFTRGEAVLVAVSGGLDSMVLLYLMARMAHPDTASRRTGQGGQGRKLTVAHFNHRLRGRSSDGDERLVERTARKLGLKFVSGSGDVAGFAKKNKLSVEMAARKLRHEFLARVARMEKIRTIALAHHADDQVELFFVRLLRGAGGEGLAGMKWVSPSPADAKISLVRPLLDVPKSVLEDFAKKERIPFREDATNAQVDFLRNRIRHELLPLLRKKYQPALERVILRQMEILESESSFVNGTAREWLRAKDEEGGGRREEGKKKTSNTEHRTSNIEGRSFDELAVAVQRRCLLIQVVKFGLAGPFSLIEELRNFPNQPITVGEGVVVARDAEGRVSVQQSGNYEFDPAQISVQLIKGAGEIAFGKAAISWKREPVRRGIFCAPKRRENCESLDAAKVGVTVVLRHWQPGDRFQPLGMEKSVKLQDLFTNEKIPRERRRELVVGVAEGGEIFWVEGLRPGEKFKLHKTSRYELNWRWKRL